jgi:chromosomal replication initiation ATPase DnaA
MTSHPIQLLLDYPIPVHYDPDDFLVDEPNSGAFSLIEQWPLWPDIFVLLVGPPGSGKTHLATLWARLSGALSVSASGITSSALPRLLEAPALIVDPCDTGLRDERAFFHLLNGLRAQNKFGLFLARTAPTDWRLTVPDLLSRVRLMVQTAIYPPNDMLLSAVLLKLFSDRQIIVEEHVIKTIIARTERSFLGLQRFVAALDARSLREGKRITRSMVLSCCGENAL